MSNVVEFPARGGSKLSREAKPITLEEFCQADAMAEWTQRAVINRMTILLYPALTLICDPGGNCSAIVRRGVDVDSYFTEALAAIA